MEKVRSPFQGVWNIVRFNWHFYVIAFGVILLLILCRDNIPLSFRFISDTITILITGLILISLIVSGFIYDFSELYKLSWFNKHPVKDNEKIININAGFDETSALLKTKFPNAELCVYDFYDPARHTEISIKRARKVYAPFPNTRTISTNHIPLDDNSAHKIFVILAAHEIRDEGERINFFKELRRVLFSPGQIIVTEHLRDTANFLAYNIGAFHFHSRPKWLKTFQASGLSVKEEIKITPFITTFILLKNGTSA
jgi:hypothetical protein